MHITLSARHMELTDAIRKHVEEQLQKLKGHFDKVIDANIVLSVEKHRHCAEITLHANGIRIHGKEETDDMYTSVDSVINKLERQIRKYKDRVNRHQPRRSKGEADKFYHHMIIAPSPTNGSGSESQEEEKAPLHHVVEREKLEMKPMDIDEATLQLELSGEKFLVFYNAETQQVNVLYDRGDGHFGLIEPEY